MAEQPEGGVIVTIGDWAVERPYLNHSPSVISKGAISTLSNTLAVEPSNLPIEIRSFVSTASTPAPSCFLQIAAKMSGRRSIDGTLAKQGNNPRVVAEAVKKLLPARFLPNGTVESRTFAVWAIFDGGPGPCIGNGWPSNGAARRLFRSCP